MKQKYATLLLVLLAGCGGADPAPKTENDVKPESRPERTGPVPVVQQELGSIDERAVQKTFFDLQSRTEKCHTLARDRIEYLTGDVKLFMRIDANGRVRYAFFEETTLGDREAEKCILDVFSKATWPKPVGGEAEVRNGFGWGPGGERAPASWGPEKVSAVLAEKDTKKELDKCKSGVKGNVTVTAYVVHDDSPEPETHTSPGKKPPPKPKGKKGDSDKGGKFQALGVAVANKEAAEKIDCFIEALKPAKLPDPGSYAAKVTFGL